MALLLYRWTCIMFGATPLQMTCIMFGAVLYRWPSIMLIAASVDMTLYNVWCCFSTNEPVQCLVLFLYRWPCISANIATCNWWNFSLLQKQIIFLWFSECLFSETSDLAKFWLTQSIAHYYWHTQHCAVLLTHTALRNITESHTALRSIIDTHSTPQY